ncbi:MAG: hypothetical protein ACQEV6_18275 [Pseudomonadota bacterium]
MRKYPKGHRHYTTDHLRAKRERKARRRRTAISRRRSQQGSFLNLVSAPPILALTTPKEHADICKFIDKIRERSAYGDLKIDFSSSFDIKVNAVILLFSTISELIEHHDIKIKILTAKCQKHVYRLLLNSGLLALTNSQSQKPDREIPIKRGDGTSIGEQVWNEVVDFILERKGNYSAEEERALSDAVSEAVLNVRHHAYPDLIEKPEQKNWWVIADFIDEQLFIAILDRGVGIHATLPYQEWWKNTVKDFSTSLKSMSGSHSAWIEASFEEGKTGTRKGERGLGGKTIKDLVRQNSDGELHVFSGRGIYISDGDKTLERTDSSHSIGGTLVQWNIRLRNV